MAYKKKKTKKSIKHFFHLLIAFGLWCFAGVMLVVAYLGWELPSVADIKPLELKPSITILADDGTLITRYGGLKGEAVPLMTLPPHVGQAVIAIEDRRFYSHYGVDLLGLGRAILINLRAKRFAQGGSTLTQQLAKNLFLTPNKTLRRKGQEMLMALMLEHKFAKDDILEAYLNRVYFGSGAYGIDAAAQTYFNKSARDLTLWESAQMAGLLKAPARYSPVADSKASAERAKTVLRVMREQGYITVAQEKSAVTHALTSPPLPVEGGSDRYFTDWILTQIDSYAGEISGDIVVKTTLNPRMQALANDSTDALFQQVKPEDRITQTAVVTVAKDGAVLAMIGGRDYAASQFNRATQAQRQPGSSFKPFVYLAALESGLKPDDQILDEPFTSGKYRPGNYEDKYFGMVTLTEALVRSLNTATIRLLSDVGIKRLLDVAKRAGFSENLPSELATGLGAGEVNLLELTNAYAAIANGGYAVWPYAVTSIRDRNGRVFYSRDHGEFPQVFSARNVYDLDGMLQQVVAAGTGQAAQLSRGHVAGKTGTTQNYRDAWFVGYTDRFVTGVWMGNDDGAPMNRVSGGKYPARLWHDYMEAALDVAAPPLVFSAMPPRDNDDGAFSSLLSRLSGGGKFTGNNRPIYNP